MVDMTSTIKAKSDQLNAGDLIGGPVVVKVNRVDVRGGDQPMSIHIDGGFQPYKPCLSMRRVLAKLWGGETDAWIGKSMVIYNDPTVIWAGKPEGGIRISHLEGITKAEEVPVRASKRSVTRYMVEPLVIQQKQNAPTVEAVTGLMNDCDDIGRMKAYGELIAEHKESFTADEIALLKKHYVDRCESIKNQN